MKDAYVSWTAYKDKARSHLKTAIEEIAADIQAPCTIELAGTIASEYLAKRTSETGWMALNQALHKRLKDAYALREER